MVPIISTSTFESQPAILATAGEVAPATPGPASRISAFWSIGLNPFGGPPFATPPEPGDLPTKLGESENSGKRGSDFCRYDRSAAAWSNPQGTPDHACAEVCRQEGWAAMKREVNVLALVKDQERYVFLYDEQSIETLLEQLGNCAADPELSFTWYDAAVLSQRVRRLREQVEEESDGVSNFIR